MKIISPVLMGLSLAVAGSTFTAAQEHHPPRPAQDSANHNRIHQTLQGRRRTRKTESAFIAAQAKGQISRLLHGHEFHIRKPRALFLAHYDSFADWEKDNKLAESTPPSSAGLERAGLADGELLDEVDQWFTPTTRT